MESLKAKFKSKEVMNGRNYADSKETVNQWNVYAVRKGEIENPVTARCYMGRSRQASTVYAAIWVHAHGVSVAGHGSAGGYGYHKESAAIQDALTSAGITLWGRVYHNYGDGPVDYSKQAHIDGVGDIAIRDALTAIARACGYRGKITIGR